MTKSSTWSFAGRKKEKDCACFPVQSIAVRVHPCSLCPVLLCTVFFWGKAFNICVLAYVFYAVVEPMDLMDSPGTSSSTVCDSPPEGHSAPEILTCAKLLQRAVNSGITGHGRNVCSPHAEELSHVHEKMEHSSYAYHMEDYMQKFISVIPFFMTSLIIRVTNLIPFCENGQN